MAIFVFYDYIEYGKKSWDCFSNAVRICIIKQKYLGYAILQKARSQERHLTPKMQGPGLHQRILLEKKTSKTIYYDFHRT